MVFSLPQSVQCPDSEDQVSTLRIVAWLEARSFILGQFPYLDCCCCCCYRFSRVQLCDPIDGSPPGSPFPEILQARTLEWVAISFSNA